MSGRGEEKSAGFTFALSQCESGTPLFLRSIIPRNRLKVTKRVCLVIAVARVACGAYGYDGRKESHTCVKQEGRAGSPPRGSTV